jgi:mannose-1-phosphate guanylyltransferase
MKSVLLSGGTGKRLWPLSTETAPKQFLKLFDNNTCSIIQRVYSQAEKICGTGNIFVAAGEKQTDIINEQIKNVKLITEPERRDTYPAIMLSAAYLLAREKISPDETIIICPSDIYAEDAFFKAFNELEALISSGKSEIAVIGIKPDYPASKYGYILPDRTNENRVLKFIEKPDEHKAQVLIDEGALWNCGVFAFRAGYLFSGKATPNDFEKFRSEFSNLEKTSFDYAVLEKAENVGVVKFSGKWQDIGTFKGLAEVNGVENFGNVISKDCENTFIINKQKIPVAVYGAKNLVICVTESGILVSDSDKSDNLKEITDLL